MAQFVQHCQLGLDPTQTLLGSCGITAGSADQPWTLVLPNTTFGREAFTLRTYSQEELAGIQPPQGSSVASAHYRSTDSGLLVHF